jgi:hypothetical protein
MREKEEKSDFYIAGEHWINSMLATAVIGLILIGIPYYYSIIDIDNLGWWPLIINPACTWLGTKYSAKLINRWYVVSSGKHIAILSTAYSITIALIFSALFGFSDIRTFDVDTVAYILVLLVFYLESSRSIGNENEDSEVANDVEEDYYTM